MKNLNFLIDWYHKENERRDSINRALNIPIGILTGLFVLFFFLLREFRYDDESISILIIIFFILLSLAVIMWAIVVINIFGSYNNFFKGYTYKAIPYPTELDEYYEKLVEYVEIQDDNLEPGITANSLYEEQFQDMLAEYLNVNISNNDLKSAYLFRAKKFLIWCFIFVVVSCFPFVYNYQLNQQKDSPTKIEIVNWIEQEVKKENNQNEQTPEKTDTTTTKVN